MPELNRQHVNDRIGQIVYGHRTTLIGCPTITTVDWVLDAMVADLIAHMDTTVDAAMDHVLSRDTDGG